jgi:hypothetical protein
MKAPWMVRLAVMAVVGLLVSQAGAAVLTVQLEFAPGETGVVTASDGNVLMNVYAYIASANGTYTDDGVGQLTGAIKSSKGGLLGNLQFINANSLLQNIPSPGSGFNLGTIQDLDGDTDLDVGGKDGNIQGGVAGSWIDLFAGANVFISPDDANRMLLGQVLFTATDITPGSSTNINWSYRVKPTLGNIDQYRLDGTGASVAGNSANLGVGPALVITPEPATMAILGLGAMVNLFIRRKRSA